MRRLSVIALLAAAFGVATVGGAQASSFDGARTFHSAGLTSSTDWWPIASSN
jgi:hypothetical protein